MRMLKRIVTGTLILSLFLSSTITSLAGENDDLGGNTSSGGQINLNPGIGDTSYVHKVMGYFEDQGYRISIVDTTGERVCNSIDIVNYIPNKPETSGDQGIIDGFYKWKDWFGSHRAPDGMDKINSFFFSNGIKTEEYSEKTWSKSGVPVHINKYGQEIETNMYMKKDFENILLALHNAEVRERQAKGESGLTEADNMHIELPAYYSDGYTSLLPGGEPLLKLLQSPIGKIGQENQGEKDNLLSFMVNMMVFVNNGRGEQTGKADYLFRFADSKLQERVGKEEVNKETGEKKITSVSDIITEKGYKVIIENLYWHVCELYTAHPDLLALTKGDTVVCYSNGVLYGTSSYINKNIYEASNIEKLGNPDFANMSWAGIQWAEYDLGCTSLMLEHNDEQLGILEPSAGGLQKVNILGLGLFTIGNLASGDNYKKIGYSVHIYDKLLMDTQSRTDTWDKINYSGSNYKPAPSPENSNTDGSPKLPDYPSEGTPYIEKNKDHKFNIVKFYSEKQPDGSYVYTENHTRNNTIHTININDEPNYKVDSYFTSPTFKQPTSNTDSYDNFKSTLPKGEKEGDKSESIVIKPESNDTTLYIRLVSTPMLTVVKYFPDGSTKTEEIPWVPSYDTNEDGYVYEEDKQSPDKPDTIPNDYEETNGTSENNPIISVKTDTRIIYIKYKQPEADSKITLHQNELAHTFTLEDIQALVKLTHSFSSKEHSGSGTHGSGSDRWHCSWHRVISDSNYSYIISNKEDYSLTSFVGNQGAFQSQEIGNNNDTGSLGIGGGSTNGLEPNLKFSVYRDKIKDNVTLYQGKNSDSIKNELSNIYITKEGYKPLTERIKNEGETEWYSTFKINYTYDTEDNTLSWGSSGCSTHGDSGSWDGTSNGLSEINNPFSQVNNVLTKAYLGQPGIGDQESTLEKTAFNILGKTFNKNLVYEKFGDKYIQFFPYIKMKYNTVEDESNKEAYIVSTNESKVRNLSSVETGVYQSKNGFGIDITSEQWSTHRKTIDGLKENGVAQAFWNKGLLPGGATIKLSTANEDNDIPEVWVGLRTYEMSIPDDLKVTLSSTESIKTTSEAKANAEQLAENVRNNLSNYHVEKWIKEGMTTNENDLNSGASKVSGVSYKINNTVYKPVTRFGDNDLSSDNKYYLKEPKEDENISKANSSKLDVVNIDENGKLKDMEIHIYNISSDTNGKVVIKKDGVEIVSANIKKDKNASSLLSNEDVKRVNERVKFVDNFIASLDFEEGKDRENRAWYYEAQDGIEVVEMTAAFQLGFGKDNAVRSEVADVKLTGKLENKGDILNFDSGTLNQKTRTVQYRMSAAPANVNCKKAGYIGTFNGQEIRVDNMYMVMRSRLYYMGNNTVMDLN